MVRWLVGAATASVLVCACGDDDESLTPGASDGGNGHQVCADYDALWTPLASQYNCEKPFSTDECELLLSVRPQCEQVAKALYACGKLLQSSEWRCSAEGKLQTTAGCGTEFDAYMTCAFPDGG